MEIEAAENIKNALSLPPNLRASLAEMLLESLDFEDDFKVDHDWKVEIQKRCHEIDTGHVELIDGDEVLLQLREKYL